MAQQGDRLMLYPPLGAIMGSNQRGVRETAKSPSQWVDGRPPHLN